MKKLDDVTIVAGACSVLLCQAVSAAMTPDSKPKEWPANAARHVVKITRTASGEAEKKMIAAAESAPPAIPAPVPGQASTTQATKETWWCNVRENVRVPYALNSAALTYYETLVLSYQKKDWKAYIEPSSKFNYEASVKKHDTFTLNNKNYKDVYEVRLKMSFDAQFTENATTGIHIEKERTVVLDLKGTVLAVEGDGETEAPVLAI